MTSPMFESSRYRHRMAITATPRTYGAKNTARNRFRPGNFRFSSQGDQQRHDQEQRHAEDGEDAGGPHRLPERRERDRARREQVGVVLQAHEGLVGQGEVVPVQADVEPVHDRADHERQEEHQVRGEEQPGSDPDAVDVPPPRRPAAAVVGDGFAAGRRDGGGHVGQSPNDSRLRSISWLALAAADVERVSRLALAEDAVGDRGLERLGLHARRPRGPAGRKCMFSICSAMSLLRLALDSASARTDLRAGIMPAAGPVGRVLAHPGDEHLAGLRACSCPWPPAC